MDVHPNEKPRTNGWFGKRSTSLDFQGMTPEQTHQAITSLMVSDMLKERRSDRRWKAVRRVITALFVLTGIGVYLATIFYEPKTVPLLKDADGYLGVVRITGTIKNSSNASAEKVVPALAEAFADPKVKAVVLSIDSPGGAPVEAERINFAIGELKKRHKKPVYAVIQNIGASAGYMIAMHTDKIYAGRYSLVGSIGAALQTWDVHEALNKRDVRHQVYASGDLKNMLNPFSPPSEAAGRKAQELVDNAGGQFFTEFKERRGNKLKDGVAYNTGEVWSGQEALKLGLVDDTGTIEQLAYVNNANVKEYKPGSRAILPAFTMDAVSNWLSSVIENGIHGVAKIASVELR